MAESTGGTGAESIATAAGITIGAACGEAWDLVAATTRVRGIGGKPRCC